MKPIPLSLLLGLALTGVSMSQAPPTAVPRSATVGELGPAITGNLLAEPQSVTFYDFDSAPDINDGTNLDGWIDWLGKSFPSSQVFSSGGANDGGRGTGGFANGTGNQDSSHPSLVMTSPPFQLEPNMAISFQIAGGTGSGPDPASLSDVPVDSMTNGFQGMALRLLSDDTYHLWARRPGAGNGFLSVGWDIATLAAVAAANPGEIFVLDWVDDDDGGWGFAMVDNVSITKGVLPGNLPLVSPPTLLAGAAGFGSTLEGTLNDPFTYNPLTPTAPLPEQGFSDVTGNGFHNDGTTSPAILVFDLATPVVDDAATQIVVDLYGRNSFLEHDNNMDIAFLDASDVVLGEVTGAAIPDVFPGFLRISSNGLVADDETVAKIRVTGHDVDFTLMELRVAQLQSAYNYDAEPIVSVTEVNGVPGDVGTPVTLPSGAALTVLSNGDFSYDPNGAFTPSGAPDTDTFTYTSNYDGGSPSTATVTVSITDADAVVYVDDDWAGLTTGDPIADADGGTAGNQPATFGTDAFATIGAATLAANANSTVLVNSGTYAETAFLGDGKALIVTGPDVAGAVAIDGLIGSEGTSVALQGASVLTLDGGSIAGIVSGTGSLVKNSSGTVGLGSANTYSGGTTLDEGVLALSDAGALGSGGITVSGASTLQLGTDTTLAGTLSGAAPLEITGGSVITLSGDASGFTDTVTISSGGLAIDAGITLGGSVAAEDGTSIGGEGSISGSLALGTPLGIGVTLVIDPSTSGALSADALTLNGITSVVGTPVFGTPTALVSYVSTFTDDSGTDSLDEAFISSGGGRPTVAKNAQTLELTVAAPEIITWTSFTSDLWEVGGPDDNWSSSDTFFVNSDHVTFDDTAHEDFGDTVTVTGTPQPGSVTFNNTIAQDYIVAGAGIGGTGGLTKDNDGLVELRNRNSFTGDTVVNNGTLVLNVNQNNVISPLSLITVNSGGIMEIAGTNSLSRNNILTDAPVILNGGTLDFSGGGHAHVSNMILRDGAVWTATSTGSYVGVNVDLDGNVTAEGTSPSTIGPFAAGIRFNLLDPVFSVADVTADPDTDLTVSANLKGGMGFSKTGPGCMFLSGINIYAGTTTVSEGCLSIFDISAIPADLTQVTVAAGAGFGGIVGASNLSDADIQTLVDDVNWDAGGVAWLVIDTNGADVTVSADITGNIGLLKKGDGVLTLTGNNTYTGGDDVQGGSIVHSVSAILVTGISKSGTTVTIEFTGGNADVYASPNLQSPWTQVGTNVAPTTFSETGVTAPKRFYALVPTGTAFP